MNLGEILPALSFALVHVEQAAALLEQVRFFRHWDCPPLSSTIRLSVLITLLTLGSTCQRVLHSLASLTSLSPYATFRLERTIPA